ncbi:YlbF family regulator [Metabacillus sp. GX 13764]|uniref:YlbF family regulator n=1 Tax=Metabacillus kandeliae TaxID=2900151 RepID=UPI001E2DC0FF|nr:YlbF family regulator [Metabacillus kandeliae]MCD7034836.1 YlbF family regulator [Metabacillus kandeliae]
MAENLNDAAMELERGIRNSSEYTELKKLYDEVNADESAKGMFDNFRNIQMNLQQKQMQGEEISQQEVDQAQQSVALVQQHPTISRLMEAEQRMSMMISELNRVIMKPLEELYGSMEG